MKTRSFKAVALLATLLAIADVRAADIDIFGGNTGDGINPNILILIDTAASNDAAFSSVCPIAGIAGTKLMDQVQCALAVAVSGLKTQPTLVGRLNIGLMEYGTSSNPGGTWVSPPSPPTALPTMDVAGVNNFVSLVTAGYAKSNSRAASAVVQEAWAFFTGHQGLSGVSYANHVTLTCQKSFIIFIGAAAKQGHPEEGNGDGGGALGLAAAGASATQQQPISTATIGPYTGEDVAWSDEWARFMYQNDFGANLNDKQNIVTYTIAATGGDPALNYVQLLNSMARRGGGKAFVAADVNAIVQALLQIFYEVQAVNSVFGSATLPVSVNTRGTYQNQVYMGMFRPDGGGSPRWMGNLKQYQFGVDTSDPAGPKLFLADASGTAAISSAGTGFISPNAVSFWTNKDTSKVPDKNPPGGFWVNNPLSVGDVYDSPDGEIVEKGGVAQQLRLANILDTYTAAPGTSSNPRNVFTCTGTCTGGSNLSATPFATTNGTITSALLGITPGMINISSLTRSGTTMTVVLSTLPNPALVNGQLVTIAGSAEPEVNGSYVITLINPQTFTYTVKENPLSPAAGIYVGTLPVSPKPITSLTRAGTTVTAVVAGHGYATNDSITITGAAGPRYNGTFAITVVDGNTFRYTIVDNPLSPGTGGVATVGSSTATIAVNGIARLPTAANNTSQVNVTATGNLPSKFAAGARVTITGASPIAYNVTQVAIIDGARSNACGVSGSAGKTVFCFTITTIPVSPDTGSATADRTPAHAISSLTHPVGCTGGSPTPNVTVTATTSASHPFATGNVVSIGGSLVGANEGAYVGSFAITKLSSTQFTYTATTTPSCTPSATGVTANTTLGSVDRDSLINWIRGEDNIGDEQSPDPAQTLVNVRPSIHGDVLHSRPSVINYGGVSNKVAVFYGANDGSFRAINGNKTGNIGSVPPGGELWSFIPSEFFPKLQRLYSNLPLLKLPTTPTGIIPAPTPKDYFFDGITGVYHSVTGGVTTAYVYLSARRGGRLLYALDVSDPSTPKFLWKKGCPNLTDNVGCDAGFAELGQTWSQPKAAFVSGWANPVLIFGAGYDANEDSEPPDTGGTGHPAMGRGIFILDAVTGCIVWQAAPSPSGTLCSGGATSVQAGMSYAIPSDLTLINRDYDKLGKIDRLYAADVGGNIWRVDLEPSGGNTPNNWQVTKFASLGGPSATKRKFLYPPDVVTAKTFDMVMAGTGDREHPLYANASVNVVNRFYGLKDLKTGMDASGATTIVDNGASDSSIGPATLFNAASGIYDGSLSGYYLTLTNQGEKVVNAPTTIGSFTYFGTNQPPLPSGLACTNLGTARGYQVNYLSASTSSQVFDGGGLPPSPTAGVVTVQVAGKDVNMPFVIGAGDPTNQTCIGPDCTSSIGAIKPVIPVSPTRRRIYWYLEKHDAQ